MTTLNRRSSIEICADILRLLRLGPAGKIEITHVAHLTGEQASLYLSRLIDAALLEESDAIMELPSFRITDKGLSLLNMIESIREMIPEDGSMTTLHNSKITDLNIGRVLVTEGVSALSRETREFSAFISESLDRYRKGDWGEVEYGERLLNDRIRSKGRRLVSAYQKDALPEIWITTNADRSYTVVMLPSEEACALYIEPIEQAR